MERGGGEGVRESLDAFAFLHMQRPATTLACCTPSAHTVHISPSVRRHVMVRWPFAFFGVWKTPWMHVAVTSHFLRRVWESVSGGIGIVKKQVSDVVADRA